MKDDFDWNKKCPCCNKLQDYVGTPQERTSY